MPSGSRINLDVCCHCRSSYKRATGSFAFALLVGLLLNLVLVALLNVAIALEDPFDNVRLRHACAWQLRLLILEMCPVVQGVRRCIVLKLV